MGNQFDLDNLNIVVDKSGKHKIMLIRKDSIIEKVGDKYEDFEQIKKNLSYKIFKKRDK